MQSLVWHSSLCGGVGLSDRMPQLLFLPILL